MLAVLPQLRERFQASSTAYPKGPEGVYAQRVYRYAHTPQDLRRAMEAWWNRLRRSLPPDLEEFRGVVRPEPYRVEAKAAQVLAMLEEGPLSLEELIRRSASRSEATAAFLALLELCRGGRVHLEGTMENPVIEKIPAQ